MSITSLRKHAVVWTHCQTWCSSTQTATGKSIAEESVHCWLQSHGALQRLEPHEVKISRSVLRGGWCSNAPSLPDWGEAGIQFYKHICTRRYLLLDTAGRCYQRGANGLEPADVQAELKRVRE